MIESRSLDQVSPAPSLGGRRRFGWRWRDASLTLRLTLPFGVMFVLMAVSMATLFITASRRSMLESLWLRAEILAGPLAVALNDPVATVDRTRVLQLIEETRKDRDVAYAVVVDANGLVLASTDTALVDKTLLRDDFERSLMSVEALDRRPVPGRQGLVEAIAPVFNPALGKIGILRVGVSTAGIDAAVRRTAFQAVVAAFIALTIALLASFYVTRRLLRPVSDAAQRLREVASGAADLTRRLNARSRNEVGMLAEGFNTFADKLAAIIGSVRAMTTTVTAASQDLSSAAGRLASGTQEQAAGLEETAASLEQITTTVKQTAEHARQASQLAGGSRDAAERGGAVVSAAVASMDEITRFSKRIADIVTVIDEIAFQTNLLALNAAVEAARAGEQGRGFAVVAAEVRSLAQRSAAAGKEIKTLIRDSVAKVEEGAGHVHRSGRTLDEIVESAKRVADIVAEIAAACQEQSAGIDQVNRAVAQMDRVTQDNASQTEELSSTSQALAWQAHGMLELVRRFVLPDGQHEVAPAPAPAPEAAVPAAPDGAGEAGKGRQGERRQQMRPLNPSPKELPKGMTMR